ncbi:predicted protein [Plenodomus lingam JN3]|uniref:Predicted protein n=1 Tax=Leptosphaeria maculans (strain JN3 / isolate v23.1.3 / race Av1-4-5-6-7-8) TaxID=985895 RepID=E5A989_LEPMJ|nr:predicted protein [Plenodomus lingam JN3]CBY00230.1 predicted protein [Plenodomus lingam JN3]
MLSAEAPSAWLRLDNCWVVKSAEGSKRKEAETLLPLNVSYTTLKQVE